MGNPIRTFQFVQISWPRMRDFQLTHRFGFEQRKFYLINLELDKFVLRTRYNLELKSPKFELFKTSSPFFVTGNFELLANVNSGGKEKFFDHNRFTLGVGSYIGDNIKIELKYKVLSFVNPTLKSYTREIDVLRIRLNYQFK